MTPARQPQHCDHECVCMGYCNRYASLVNEPCPKHPCQYDTRATHTSPPAPAFYKTQIDEDGAIGKVAICLCEQCKVNGFLCLKSPKAIFTPYIPGKENSNTYRCCEVCPNVLSKPVFRCNCLQPEHDAQVAKAAREKVLVMWENEITLCPFDRCKKRIESLREQQGGEP